MIAWSLVTISAATDPPRSINLAWNANPEADIAGYRVHYGTASGALTSSLTVDTSPAATLAGLEPGTRYYCAVRAFNTSALEGSLSSEISFVIPAATAPEITVAHDSAGELADGQREISLGEVALGSTGATQTFVIRNLGTADLTNLAITADSAEFAVTPLGTTTLVPGETTRFDVTFSPSASGIRPASLRVASNDANENPFDIALTGTGVAMPEIAIQHPVGFDLTDATSTVHFTNSLLGTTTAPETFTLRNTGTADLTGIGISADGAGSDDFILGPPAVSTLAPGASTTFSIAFSPHISGVRSATLRVASNDANENPFDITLTGTAVAIPDISVTHADGIDLAASGATLDLGNVTIGDAESVGIFSIANLGTADLTALKITLDGPHDSEFKVDFMTGDSLPPGASATVQVTFSPTADGTRTASLHITSNDPDESRIAIDLTGTGVAMPEFRFPQIAVSEPSGTVLADAVDTQEFGGIHLANTGEARTYTLSNSGTADLTGLAIATGGAHAADFIVSPPAVTSLTPGSSTTLRIAFRPSAGGTRNATLHITSNDPDTDSFDIALSGTGLTAPEIEVYKDNGTSLTSGGSSVDFGNCNLGATTSPRTFTIQNTGSATLTGLSVASDGPDFILGNLGSTSLPPGARTTFGISFRPGTAGTRAARLVIASNDSDERQFLIPLTGQGVKAPEIVVEVSSGRSLTDDDAFINFGTAAVGSTANSKTFTIRNTGTANLDGLGIIKNGINSSEFRVSALRTRSLAPGASTTFKVHFSPAKTGIRWAAIHITSNDADERSFDIVLTGTGSKSSTSAAAAPSLTGSHTIPTSSPVRRIELIDGRKYLTLTIARRPGTSVLPRDVEVSSNLVDWSSGNRHTTVLIDTATTLKVRDNTPVSQNARRYIRRKR